MKEKVAQAIFGIAKKKGQETALSATAEKLRQASEQYNPIIWLLAIFIAFLSDMVGFLPFAGPIIGFFMQAFVSYLIWRELGRFKRDVLKLFVKWILLPLVIDPIISLIFPAVGGLCFLNTIITILACNAAKKHARKQGQLAADYENKARTIRPGFSYKI
ncbi:MAG: hypothetical protein ABIC19_03935 [Patescibacteria group bacterium]|nr:hypothetical protein [Patescibacteria group bacterium]